MMKLFLCAVLMGMGTSVMAQLPVEMQTKASKEARKDAKKLKKQGWTVTPGSLPLERQLERSYTIQYEETSNFQPKFVVYEGQSVGQNYDAAKITAEAIARQGIAGKISSEIMSVVEAQTQNKELAQEQAASIVKVCQESTSKLHQNLGRIIPAVECYRKLKNGNYEVLVRAAYNMEQGKKTLTDMMNKELKIKGYEYTVSLEQ